LRCSHCYSSSSPEKQDILDPKLLCEAISNAHDEGFTLAGFSGGEPLLYDPLAELLQHASSLGMLTTVTTNGMLLTKKVLNRLEGNTDLIAISLDGLPSSHNEVRDHPRAFEQMQRRLDSVRELGIPFGFIFTLTLYNVDELRWVADFALEQGANLLQIHPLEESGRANKEMIGFRPDATEMSFALIEAIAIQASAGDRMRVHVDFTDRDLLRNEPNRIFAGELQANWRSLNLSDLVSPIVIEPDGSVVPIQYGFDRRFALGNLQTASLGTLAQQWRNERYLSFREVCRTAWQEITKPEEIPLVNWYEVLLNSSRTMHTSVQCSN
jgi:MoaA/NifB/PqqE/SkfB family radical SAM enzyme